ncbi:uncharacterized protein [Panulirus ornatus]|uniref:uncharacterized protein n=1 Tax=Panulirus ornatus TaxID=150431 RepID=UPI003A845EE0
MAECKLSRTRDHVTLPPSNMWYAHNYAQRRSQARNNLTRGQHYTADYAHDLRQEYPHAQPLLQEPFHVCQEHLPLPTSDYSRSLQQYLAQYARTALHGHAYATDQSHAHSTANTIARSTARASRTHAHTADHSHAHTIARTHNTRATQNQAQTTAQSHAHTGGQSHTHTGGQSHAHTGGQSHAHTGGQSQTNKGGHSHSHSGGQSHAHTGSQSHNHTGSQSHAHTSGKSYAHTGGQSQAHTGGQSHAHSGGQSHAHTGGQSHTHSGGQSHAHSGSQSHAHTGGKSYGNSSEPHQVHTSGRNRSHTPARGHTQGHTPARGHTQGHTSARGHTHGPDQALGRQALRKLGHSSSRSHTHSIDQSHALTDDQTLAHIVDPSHPYSVDHGRAYTVDQNHAFAAGQNHGYTVDQNHAYSVDQNHAYTLDQNHAYAVDEDQAHPVDQNHGHMGDVDINSLYPYSNGHPYTHGFRYVDEQGGRGRGLVGREREYQGASSQARPHQDHHSYRVRSQDMWAFYPESVQSSDEEESVLQDDVRVDLPYTHHQCRGRSGGREEYGVPGRGEHIIRRFHDPGEAACDEEGEVSTVGLSYQQRADVCHTRGHMGSSLALADAAEGVDRRRGGLLLAEGLVREWVRAVGVVAASGTLVTLVLLGFGVYNMLITTLFLLFVLTTVALLIFLLMRRPPCCPCCQDPYDTSASAAGSTGSQAANITYLTETHGIVVKKWMKDSPPPYESPPDYNSLSPELIMDAKTLQELVNTSQAPASQPQALPAGVHNPTTSAGNQGRSPSPLCTTPLFSPSFCDSPRSLTPTMHQETKLLGVYDRPPSPIFTQHQQYPSSTSTHCHPSTAAYMASSTAPTTVPSAGYGQPAPSPPAYETLRLYSYDGRRRKEDNQ